MNSIFICFSLKSSVIGMAQLENFEKDYQTVYKPAAKFLYSHPNFRMSFSFNGVLLQYLKKKYPEFLEILQQLISRKQIEILGGGFYDPVFPLLFPMDRSGQIEMLSSEIRQTTGKRPRGMTLCASCWDSSMLPSFKTCGMEFVLLDSSLIPPEKQKFLMLIMSDKGKSIDIVPVYNELKPSGDMLCSDYLNNLRKIITKSLKKENPLFTDENRIVTVQFMHEEFKALLESGWFEKLDKEINDKNNSDFILSVPGIYKKGTSVRLPAFISSGISGDIEQWTGTPYSSVSKNERYPVTIYDFFQTYPQTRALYDRMLYISMLVNQCHGDKMRKKAAREKLWQAQNGDGFICTSKGAFVNSAYRQQAYKYLTEAEKILRECGKFTESIASFDYNGDGLNEYICRMQNYFACISLLGGSVRELDVMQNSGNFADNLSRIAEFEGCSDGYERGLFVDHVFSSTEFDKYIENKPSGSGIFSRVRYSEARFSEQHREILLSATAEYKNIQKISLRKKYIAASGGLMVQYILKNESDRRINAKFTVESSFAQTNFTARDFNAFRLEIVNGGKKQEIDTKSSSHEINTSGILADVEGVQLTDTDNAISFVFVPNEICGLSFVPITFSRPEYTTGELVPAGMTFAITMFWDINLEPGMEMEKTINFSILSEHKHRRSVH